MTIRGRTGFHITWQPQEHWIWGHEMDSERSADLTCVGERMGRFIPTAIRSPFVAMASFMAIICLVRYQIDRTGSLSKLHYHAAQIASAKLSGSFNQLRYLEPCQVFSQLDSAKIWHNIKVLRLLQSENNLEWDLMQIFRIKIVILT